MIPNRKPSVGSARTFFGIRCELLVCLGLITTTLLAYWEVSTFTFVRYDDPVYVLQNPIVRAGLSLESIAGSFVSTQASNWHPLTWLSHMLDVQLWGLHPAGHHLTSLMLHVANALLLFIILNRTTGHLWASGLVAALFALHPLHVESVAWVAERKDVLSTFFGFLALHAYARYVENPVFRRYATVFILFVFGLMAKPMLVTLPFVMLLLDYWPLKRLDSQSVTKLLQEKVPLFVAAGLSSIVTFVVQQQGGAMHTLETYPLSIRLANALVAYGSYIGKAIWPTGLAVLYPHPGMPSLWQLGGIAILLACISWLVRQARHGCPYLLVGWLWYLGSLVPVIGLIQVGEQSMADRYTYVPAIGLFIMAAWGIADLTARLPHRRVLLILSALVVLPTLIAATRLQAGHWRDSIALFERALAVTTDNYVAHNNLGNALAARGRLAEAILQYQAAIRINPAKAQSFNNLGATLMLQGKNEKARVYFHKALEIQPNYPDALKNLQRIQSAVNRARSDSALP